MATKREHLLIDGYNLIKASQLFQGRGDSLERARNRLQQALAAYGRRADKHITLYYDGTGAAPSTVSASGPHVTIEFSRYPQQADDLIAQAVAQKHGAKWLRVVSSDRAVQRCAARHKIRSTCSEDFLDELTGPVQAPSTPEPAPARDGTESDPSLDPGELDQWEAVFRKKADEAPSTTDRDGAEARPPLDPDELDHWEALFRKKADR
ncbi:MAG: NYN domain-containing protein [Candidatus Latescibacteria bacterium]|nr:NYN domain-containing protein [Candidatus Latescibacterota bacterium]